MKGKARFKGIEDYKAYIEFFELNAYNNFNIKNHINSIIRNNKLYTKEKVEGYKMTIPEYINQFERDYLGTFFDNKYYINDFKKSIEFTNSYIDTMGGSYDVVDIIEDICILEYGQNVFIVVNYDKYLDVEYISDVESLTLSEYKNISLLGGSESPMNLMIPGEDKSIKSLKKERASIEDEMNDIQKRMKQITDGVAPEFIEIQRQIKVLEEQLNKQKNEMLSEIQKQKTIMEVKMKELQKKLTILQDSIYTIQCYLGETIELYQIRTGKHSDISRPMIINQKLKYLDEDLAQLFSIYSDDVDGGGYKLFEQLLKYNDKAFEFFTPYDKCIAFFKISKDCKNYGIGEIANVLSSFNVLHGEKVGFLVRDGENLFIGYTDEEKIYVSEDVFLKPGTVVETPLDDETMNFKSSSYKEMASRMFIFSILQGLLERSEITRLPEKINIFSSFANNKYIHWNYAEGWLKDNRFGSFANLTKKLNELNTVGDDILLILKLRETSWKSYESNRGRADAYVNRTHDCSVKEGLNRINMIGDDDSLYVSATKANSWKGATANFLIERDEFINLTYMNSEWLKYFLISKEIGNFETNYAYLAKFLKIALEFIQERELSEESLIKQYYPNIDKVHEWVVVLSHWKIINKVRKITDFQAKRFAKYLKKGKVINLTNLFNGNYKHRSINELNNIKQTEVGKIISVRWYERHYISPNASEEDIEKRFIENRLEVQKAYEIVKQEAVNNNITWDMIETAIESKHKNDIKSLYGYRVLFNEDFSFKPFKENDFTNTHWGYDPENFKSKEKFYEVVWSNNLISIYKEIFTVIETINSQKFKNEITILPIKFK